MEHEACVRACEDKASSYFECQAVVDRCVDACHRDCDPAKQKDCALCEEKCTRARQCPMCRPCRLTCNPGFQECLDDIPDDCTKSEQCHLYESTSCKHFAKCDEKCESCDTRSELGAKEFLNPLAACGSIVCERITCQEGETLFAEPMECCPTCHRRSAPSKSLVLTDSVDDFVKQVDKLTGADNVGDKKAVAKG